MEMANLILINLKLTIAQWKLIVGKRTIKQLVNSIVTILSLQMKIIENLNTCSSQINTHL